MELLFFYDVQMCNFFYIKRNINQELTKSIKLLHIMNILFQPPLQKTKYLLIALS